jgi:hypothetical protein
MLIKSKPLIALGILGTVLLATASPSLAKQAHHHRTRATETVQAPWQNGDTVRSPFALAPTYRSAPNLDDRSHYSIPRNGDPLETWDEYGQRWD